jgi:peptidoglycan hydrolase FlgJ
MADFLGSSEVIARTDMMGMTNKLQEITIQANKADRIKDAKYLAQVKNVSREFESIFLGYMLQQMRKTVPEDALMGNSPAKDIFQSMQDEELSKELSRAGGIGLASMIYSQLASQGVTTPKRPVAPVVQVVPSKTDITI